MACCRSALRAGLLEDAASSEVQRCLPLPLARGLLEPEPPGSVAQPASAPEALEATRGTATSTLSAPGSPRHQWIQAKAFPGHVAPMAGLPEDLQWQELIPEWNDAVSAAGADLSKVEFAIALCYHVQEPYYTFLGNGKKVVEGRCNVRGYANLEAGQLLLVNDSLVLLVEGVRKYPTFRSMLAEEGLSRVLPGTASLEDGVQVYRKFYSEEQEAEAGVVAITVTAASKELTLSNPVAAIRKLLKASRPPYPRAQIAAEDSALGMDGIRTLLGLRTTAGTVREGLPPPRAALLASFSAVHDAQTSGNNKLTVGARALAKHAARSASWGSCNGSHAAKSAAAAAALGRLLGAAAWLN
eukprot:SM000015S01192  [mRNA]  locus=s15:358444:361556:- [translate_table: standard]